MKLIKVLEHIRYSGKSYLPGDVVAADTFGKDTDHLLRGTQSKENPFGSTPSIAYAEEQVVAVAVEPPPPPAKHTENRPFSKKGR